MIGQDAAGEAGTWADAGGRTGLDVARGHGGTRPGLHRRWIGRAGGYARLQGEEKASGGRGV